MTRTTIKIISPYSPVVELSYDDLVTGERITRKFFTPNGGGYVRDEDGRQVCVGLGRFGNTLEATGSDDLLKTIRKEWASYRRWMAKEFS